jgi:hypothetical protein
MAILNIIPLSKRYTQTERLWYYTLVVLLLSLKPQRLTYAPAEPFYRVRRNSFGYHQVF